MSYKIIRFEEYDSTGTSADLWTEVPNTFDSDISALDAGTSVGYITSNLQVSRASEDE
jgi:hypothetical protein